MDTIEAAKKQVDLFDRYGIQARQELTQTDIIHICREYIALQNNYDDLAQQASDLLKDRADAVKQRDSANGKLSALQRKYAALEKDNARLREQIGPRGVGP